MSNTNTTLLDRLKSLSLLSLNGINYLGKVSEEEGKTKIVDSIQVTTPNFTETIKSWIKKDNLGELETVSLRGSSFSLGEKDFSEEQQHNLTIIAAEAEYRMKRAVKRLENDSI